jgi:hypothetical protein
MGATQGLPSQCVCATILTAEGYFKDYMRSARSNTARDSQLASHQQRWWTSAIWLLVAAQLFLAVGPVLEAQFGADARPHVEIAGTNTHHAHNPADCATCAARAMLAVPDCADFPGVPSLLAIPPAVPARDGYPDFLRESGSRPRAPPLRQA